MKKLCLLSLFMSICIIVNAQSLSNIYKHRKWGEHSRKENILLDIHEAHWYVYPKRPKNKPNIQIFNDDKCVYISSGKHHFKTSDHRTPSLNVIVILYKDGVMFDKFTTKFFINDTGEWCSSSKIIGERIIHHIKNEGSVVFYYEDKNCDGIYLNAPYNPKIKHNYIK